MHAQIYMPMCGGIVMQFEKLVLPICLIYLQNNTEQVLRAEITEQVRKAFLHEYSMEQKVHFFCIQQMYTLSMSKKFHFFSIHPMYDAYICLQRSEERMKLASLALAEKSESINP